MRTHPLFEKKRIFAPGPTPVPEEILGVLARAPLHHRTKAFIEVLSRTKKNLQFLFETKEQAYLFSSSGTGAMEAAIVNLLKTGDTVLVLQVGKFGERWVKIAKAYGMEIALYESRPGYAANPDEIKKLLQANKNIKAVLLQASETSTGVANPVKEISKVIHENSEALVIVDAITALGVSPLPLDEWGLDAVVGGSQKALMLPPGLACLALSKRAHARRAQNGIPRFYFDLNAEDKAWAGGETAWTPAVGLVCALDVVLAQMVSVGLPKVFTFHEKLAEGTRIGVKAMGLELYPKEFPSAAVTAIHVPKEISDGKTIISTLRDDFGITIAGGQGDLKGKIFRLGHLGFFDQLDMLSILAAVEMTLNKLGYGVECGKGVGAASRYFMESDA